MMKRILEELRVESFGTEDGLQERRGTVRGRRAITEGECRSDIIACPILYSEGSCADDACYDSDAYTCTFDNTKTAAAGTGPRTPAPGGSA
jgi:hypothetical protein